MSIYTEITVKEVEQFNNEIKQALVSKGINNTGQASNSIRIDVDEANNSVKSIGVDYLEVLDKGRGPGKHPPIKAIEDWVKNKPVDIVPFLVARKIAKFGTNIYQNPSLQQELVKKGNIQKKKFSWDKSAENLWNCIEKCF